MARLIDADALKERIGELCINNDDMFSEKAYERIIGVIEVMPTAEPEVLHIPKEVSATDLGKLTEMIKSSLLQAYPNDAMFTAVRRGRWMFHEQKNGYLWKCSNCKGNFDQRFSYCPHCGAEMG